jgi:transcriptional regulator with XRE-family HTH domain
MQSETLKKNLAANLIRLRESRGLTQTTLAEHINAHYKTDLTRSNIAAYETSGTTPKLDALYAMAHFFNQSIDDLLRDGTEAFTKTVFTPDEILQLTQQFNKASSSWMFYKIVCARFYKVAQEFDMKGPEEKSKINLTEQMTEAYRDAMFENTEDFKRMLKEILTEKEYDVYVAARKADNFASIATKMQEAESDVIRWYDSARKKINDYIDKMNP